MLCLWICSPQAAKLLLRWWRQLLAASGSTTMRCAAVVLPSTLLVLRHQLRVLRHKPSFEWCMPAHCERCVLPHRWVSAHPCFGCAFKPVGASSQGLPSFVYVQGFKLVFAFKRAAPPTCPNKRHVQLPAPVGPPSPQGFKLVFAFKENPFFTNAELTKTYFMGDGEDMMLKKVESESFTCALHPQ